jgi:glutamate N-acetyltransferase/amino-acid N-acetyltransferase
MVNPETELSVAGVRLGVAAAGIRYRDRDDLVLMELAEGSSTTAVFTRNAFCAAPVQVARAHLVSATPRALLINAGNANAGTGQNGIQAARECCRLAAGILGCSEEEIVPFSTGVIGEQLAVAKFRDGIETAAGNLNLDGWERAARAIMTTDTRPKVASRQICVGTRTVTVTGMAKGSGMICPDMATLLAFVTTDAKVERNVLHTLLEGAMQRSFNRITVDGDTSTNDACVLAATGLADNAPITSVGDEAGAILREAVAQVCEELAEAVVRDGEGASKFIRIRVVGGRNVAECRQVAYTVAHSPLVKTAFYACDANWGRILAAVGRAGLQQLDLERVQILLDDVVVACRGGRDPDYREARGAEVMAKPDILVTIVLGRGDDQAEVWTCDLSHDYVSINAAYRS